jgi:hypothetical protein
VENSEESKQAGGGGAGTGGGDNTPNAPIIHANTVSMVLTEDELVIELREWHVAHAEMDMKMNSEPVSAPMLSLAGFKVQPVKGIVVLTFGAARSMQDYLNRTLPIIQKSRVDRQAVDERAGKV